MRSLCFLRILCQVMLCALLIACGSGDQRLEDSSGPAAPPPPPPPPPDDTPLPAVTAEVVFMHAVSDAPNLRISVDDLIAVSNAGYGDGTALTDVGADNVTVAIATTFDDGGVINPEVFSLPTVNFDVASDNYALAYGNLADSSITLTQFTAPATIASTEIQINLAYLGANTAENFATVSVNLSSNNDSATEVLSLGQAASVNVPAGNYQLDVTDTVSNNSVFTASVNTLIPGNKYLLAFVDHFGAGTSPLRLEVNDASSSSQTTYYDSDAGAELRVMHNVGNRRNDAIDIQLSQQSVAPFTAVDFVTELNNVSAYTDVSPGMQQLSATVSGSGEQIISNTAITLSEGKRYTAIASGRVNNNNNPPIVIVLEDDLRAIDGIAKARAVHGYTFADDIFSGSLGISDIRSVNAVVNGMNNLPGGTRVFQNITYTDVSPNNQSYIFLPADEYSVEITDVNENSLPAFLAPNFDSQVLQDRSTNTFIIGDDDGGRSILGVFFPTFGIVTD